MSRWTERTCREITRMQIRRGQPAPPFWALAPVYSVAPATDAIARASSTHRPTAHRFCMSCARGTQQVCLNTTPARKLSCSPLLSAHGNRLRQWRVAPSSIAKCPHFRHRRRRGRNFDADRFSTSNRIWSVDTDNYIASLSCCSAGACVAVARKSCRSRHHAHVGKWLA